MSGTVYFKYCCFCPVQVTLLGTAKHIMKGTVSQNSMRFIFAWFEEDLAVRSVQTYNYGILLKKRKQCLPLIWRVKILIIKELQN